VKIVITGSRGMLGTDVLERLKDNNEIMEVDVDIFDITDRGVINYLIDREPEFIFHLAAFTDVDRAEKEKDVAYRVNVKGTENIIQVCRKRMIPLLFISTDYVFDGKKESPYREDDKTNPLCFYGKTKAEAEKLIKEALHKFFIVRTSWLFGKNGSNFVDTIISLSEKENSIKAVDDQTGSPTYTRDLALSLERFLRSEDYGIYHITNRNFCTWFEFAKKIVSMLGRDTEVLPQNSEQLKRPALRPPNSTLDNSLFEQKFKFRMPTWEDALCRYITNKKLKE
jgi:dTDP-4-dehydrorhamnose reductase